MAQESRRRLCIDFGTSNTAAAYRVGFGEPVIVPLGPGGPAMPSAVFAADATVVVGHDAVQRRLQAPDAFEDTPKSRIDDGEIELGDRFWPVEDLIAAVLRLDQTEGKTGPHAVQSGYYRLEAGDTGRELRPHAVAGDADRPVGHAVERPQRSDVVRGVPLHRRRARAAP